MSIDSLASAVRSYLDAADVAAAVGAGPVTRCAALDQTRRVLLDRLAEVEAARRPASFAHVFVAVDDSAASARAGAVAGRLAAAAGAEVAVCHVIDTSRGFSPEFQFAVASLAAARRPAAEQLLDRMAGAVGHGIQPVRIIRPGEPAKEVLAAAAEWGADVIVVGTHAGRGLKHLLLGSTATAVVRGASCAVLTVGGGRAPVVAA